VGSDHVALLLKGGRIATFGHNQHGQLGHSEQLDQAPPQVIAVDSVMIFNCHTFFETLSRSLWGWQLAMASLLLLTSWDLFVFHSTLFFITLL
jgi:alpha-tubulin suppressor-like RCC1 family protein